MLLTSSQVSMILSSSIIIIFTLLLFLTGYTLQRQTVTALSAGIRPRVLLLASQVTHLPELQSPSGTGPYDSYDAEEHTGLYLGAPERGRSQVVINDLRGATDEEGVNDAVSDPERNLRLRRPRGGMSTGRERVRVGMEDGVELGPGGKPLKVKLAGRPNGLEGVGSGILEGEGERWVKMSDGWRVVRGPRVKEEVDEAENEAEDGAKGGRIGVRFPDRTQLRMNEVTEDTNSDFSVDALKAINGVGAGNQGDRRNTENI